MRQALRIYGYVLALLMLTAASSVQSDPAPELQRAFAAMPKVNLAEWRFRETRRDQDGVEVRTYDPSLKEPWQLISVDGQAPDDDAIARHRERLIEERKRDSGQPGENDFNGLAEPDSWALVRSETNAAVYEFQPAPGPDDDEDDAKMMAKLSGELTLDRASGFVRSFRIYNDAPFRAKLVAKIDEVETLIQMSQIAPDVHFATRVTTRIKGRAFGLKKLDSASSTEYDQFERISTPLDGASDVN